MNGYQTEAFRQLMQRLTTYDQVHFLGNLLKTFDTGNELWNTYDATFARVKSQNRSLRLYKCRVFANFSWEARMGQENKREVGTYYKDALLNFRPDSGTRLIINYGDGLREVVVDYRIAFDANSELMGVMLKGFEDTDTIDIYKGEQRLEKAGWTKDEMRPTGTS